MFTYFHIFEKEKETEGDRETESPIQYSLCKYPQQPKLTRPSPGAQNAIWVFHMGGRYPNTWAIICCLPGCIARRLME